MTIVAENYKEYAHNVLSKLEKSSKLFSFLVVLFLLSSSALTYKIFSDFIFNPTVTIEAVYQKEVELGSVLNMKVTINRGDQEGCFEMVDRHIEPVNQPPGRKIFIPVSSSFREVTEDTQVLDVYLDQRIDSPMFSPGEYVYKVKYFYTCNIFDRILGPKQSDVSEGIKFKVLPVDPTKDHLTFH